jgi:rhodanese-related sulfurtransferase
MLYKQMNIQNFENAYQEDSEAMLLDVRTPEEVAEGHLDGMLALDFLAADFEQQIMKLDPHKSYYVYCRSGKRSEQACLLLSRKGFENVTNLQGGYLAWLQK